MLIKRFGTGIKGPIWKRPATKVLFFTPTEKEINTSHQLQKAFASPTIQAHFDTTRLLFIDPDTLKSFDSAATTYHIKNNHSASKDKHLTGKVKQDKLPPRTDVQPIIFLSGCLNTAERNYWPTELEVAGVVWVVKKVRHMIESSKVPLVIIDTDHSATSTNTRTPAHPI